MLRTLTGRHKRKIPYTMFRLDDYGLQAKNAKILERVYHKSQKLSWDGKEVLSTLIEQHGMPQMPPKERKALGRVFAVIMWGELAAWRISAELADEIEPLEPKMAATSQAFDEARHFYVMHDYLRALDALPDKLDWAAQNLLEQVMNADHLAKKLLGMQLMVEPIALTLFHVIKKLDVEPVLTGLLPYYERDEARHVALGIQYLPAMLEQMSVRERLGLWRFQVELIGLECFGARTIQQDLVTLGVDPMEMMAVGKGKQMQAFDQVFKSIQDTPLGNRLTAVMERYADVMSEVAFVSTDKQKTLRYRADRMWKTLWNGSMVQAKGGLEPDVADEDVPMIRGLRGLKKPTLKRKKKRGKNPAATVA